MIGKTAILIGSSRSNGNTTKVVNYFIDKCRNCKVFDLNNYKIGYYDYEFKNANDDFFQLYNELLKFDTLVFATPIYWYTMSAQMKTFFDRISDMLQGDNKMYGRQLKGKSMAVVSCGSDDIIFEGFDMPFRQSANYLNMKYIGHVHTWLNNDGRISTPVKNSMIDINICK